MLSLVVASIALANGSRCIFVSNDHSDALEEWVQFRLQAAPPAPVAVLHVDAHNDLNVPTASWASSTVFLGRPTVGWFQNSTVVRELLNAVDLASFQLAAVWAGLVDRIIWIRQGDAPPTDSKSRLTFDHSTRMFDDNILHSVDEEVTERLDDGLYTFHERSEETLNYAEVLLTTKELFEDRDYVLDIDLDFFVASDARPPKAPWAAASPSRQSPQDAFTGAFPHALCGQLLLACRRWSDPRCTFWDQLEAALPCQHQTCDPCEQAFDQWLQQYPGLQGTNLHIAERTLIAAQSGRSHLRPGPRLVSAQVERLESLLSAIGKPPVAITVARSIDGFVRVQDVPFLESAVMDMVRRIWYPHQDPPCVRYASGTASLEALEDATLASTSTYP